LPLLFKKHAVSSDNSAHNAIIIPSGNETWLDFPATFDDTKGYMDLNDVCSKKRHFFLRRKLRFKNGRNGPAVKFISDPCRVVFASTDQ
jgi:hypothetical protein